MCGGSSFSADAANKGEENHETFRQIGITRGDADVYRLASGCAGVFRNQNWTATGPARGSRAAGASRPGLLLGGWLLVSGEWTLPLARRLLDSSAVRGSALGWTSLRWATIL